MKTPAKIALFVVIGIMAVGAMKGTDKTEATPVAKETTAQSFATTPAPAIETTPALPAEPASEWMYSTDEDKMGETTKKATVVSPDQLSFDFPFNGGSTAYLIARKSPKFGTDLIFQVSKGMIHSSEYNGGSVRLKLDDGKPFKVGYSTAADGSHEVIFLDGAAGLIKKLQGAKKAVIEVEFYQEGRHQVAFPVEGLKWPIPENA